MKNVTDFRKTVETGVDPRLNEMPVSLRKLSKHAFKRKIKQTLFEILASEGRYIDLPEVVQKVISS